MYQEFTIVGNVGRDPELRYTQSGVAVCDFSVAVNKVYTTSGGERREETTWVRVTVWRRTAETVNQYLKKGRQVLCVGEASVSAYLDRSGQPAASLEMTANIVKFLGGRDETEGGYSGGGGNRNQHNEDDFSPPPRDMNDIPF